MDRPFSKSAQIPYLQVQLRRRLEDALIKYSRRIQRRRDFVLWQLTTQRLPFPVPRHDPETGRTASAQIEPEAEFQVPTHLLPLQGVGTSAQMPRIDADVLVQLPLTDVGKVTFYKRDEVTTDLIC